MHAEGKHLGCILQPPWVGWEGMFALVLCFQSSPPPSSPLINSGDSMGVSLLQHSPASKHGT